MCLRMAWIPACAGMTGVACAGMTGKESGMTGVVCAKMAGVRAGMTDEVDPAVSDEVGFVLPGAADFMEYPLMFMPISLTRARWRC